MKGVVERAHASFIPVYQHVTIIGWQLIVNSQYFLSNPPSMDIWGG